MPVNNLIQVRRGSSFDWNDKNPILASGELGYEYDISNKKNLLKIGNGIDNWQDLDYVNNDDIIRVRNNDGFTFYKGQAVYIVGTYDNIPNVSLFNDGGSPNNLFAGLLSSNIAHDNIGNVITRGILYNLNTTGTLTNISIGSENWQVGDVLYISKYDYGKMTNVKPDTNIIPVGIVLNAHSIDGSIYVHSSLINRKLGDLNDTIFGNLQNDNLVKYNSANSKWSNTNDIDGGFI